MTLQTFLSLDLELNQPSGRIIEVGVCIGSIDQDEKDYLVRNWYLDPSEGISEFITGLTGISDETIRDKSVPLGDMARDLSALIREHDPFVNPVTWGGGDSSELLKELALADINFPHFGRRWVDVKTLHVFQQIAQGKAFSGGLRSAMTAHKLSFVGTPHRAGHDAYNTLRLFFTMMRKQQQIYQAIQALKQ